jgi:hypothetical protein
MVTRLLKWCAGVVVKSLDTIQNLLPDFFFFFNYVNKFLFPSWSIIPLLKVLAAVHFDICKKSKY